MARLLTAGFETGSTQELNGAESVGIAVVAGPARTGNYSLQLLIRTILAPAYKRHSFSSNVSDLYFRFAMRWDGPWNYDSHVMSVRDDDGTNQCYLLFDHDNQTLDWYVDGVLVASGNISIGQNIWYVIEGRVLPATSGGSVVCKVNGTTDATWTGDTAPSGKEHVRSVGFNGINSGTGLENLYLDDIAFNDTTGVYQNSWVGLGGCKLLKPEADGGQNDWTPTSGSDNYAMVDDVPADDDTWVQALTTDDLDLYDVEDCPEYVNQIDLVQVVYQGAVVVSGSNDVIDVIRQGVTDYDGETHTIVSIEPDWVLYRGKTHYVQPSGAGAWTPAAVDAMQAGIKIG